jgi:Ran GTPase-activating protein (RanGAP) involved in mRNA processing and transport
MDLTMPDLDWLCAGLLTHPNVLERFTAAQNPLGLSRAGDHVARLLATCPTLREVNLSGCGLGIAFTRTILPALAQHSGLETLDLSHNHLATPGRSALVEILATNPRLRLLKVGDNTFAPEDLRQLKEAIRRHPGLTAVGLRSQGAGTSAYPK